MARSNSKEATCTLINIWSRNASLEKPTEILAAIAIRSLLFQIIKKMYCANLKPKGGLPVPVAPKEVHEAREVFAVNELDQEPFGDIVEKMNSPSL